MGAEVYSLSLLFRVFVTWKLNTNLLSWSRRSVCAFFFSFPFQSQILYELRKLRTCVEPRKEWEREQESSDEEKETGLWSLWLETLQLWRWPFSLLLEMNLWKPSSSQPHQIANHLPLHPLVFECERRPRKYLFLSGYHSVTSQRSLRVEACIEAVSAECVQLIWENLQTRSLSLASVFNDLWLCMHQETTVIHYPHTYSLWEWKLAALVFQTTCCPERPTHGP